MADKVYVGNLDVEAGEKDLERAFGRFGAIKSIWIARKPPGFAFVTFEDVRDAEDAVAELNGKEILRQRVRVEVSTSRDQRRGEGRGGGGGRYGDDRRGGGGGYGGGGYGGRRDDYRPPPPRRRSPSYERGGYMDRRQDRPRSRSRSGPRGGGGIRNRSPPPPPVRRSRSPPLRYLNRSRSPLPPPKRRSRSSPPRRSLSPPRYSNGGGDRGRTPSRSRS